jgi:hypothetical protein
MFNVSAIVLVFSCVAGPSVLAQSSGHLTLQDLLSVEPIGETALSPDDARRTLVTLTREHAFEPID